MDITYTTLLSVHSSAAEELGRYQEKIERPNCWKGYWTLRERDNIKHSWLNADAGFFFRREDLTARERAFLAGFRAGSSSSSYPVHGIVFHVHLVQDGALLDLLTAIKYPFTLRKVTQEGDEADVLVRVTHSVAQFWQALNGVQGVVPVVTILPTGEEVVSEEEQEGLFTDEENSEQEEEEN